MGETAKKKSELKEGEMLLFIGDSGLHITQESDEPEVLSVRARSMADLLAVFPDATVVTDNGRDDKFRYVAKISRECVVLATFDWLMRLSTKNGKVRTDDFKQKELTRVRELIDLGMLRKAANA